MSKILKLGIVSLVVLAIVVIVAKADDNPTIVYGAAATPEGGQNVFVVEQPENAPNPLGDPLVSSDKPVKVYDIDDAKNATENSASNSSAGVNEQSAKNLGDDFQNTLMEANGRVYDVQSYPVQDFKAMENPSNPQTIYSPNVND